MREGPKRILLVEDEHLTALTTRSGLEQLGYEVATADTIETALEALGGCRFDAAVLDLDLAGRSARPVVERLEAQAIPFVVSTGYPSLDVAAPSERVRLVQKPYGVEHIGRALAAALAH